jgi:predicted transcriptional regulator
MAHLKLASTKITPELVERLNRYTESTGLTQSAAIRQAIVQFLDNAESTKLTGLTNGEGSFRPSQLVTTVDRVDDRSTELTDIEGNLAPSQLVVRVDAVDARLTDFEARLELLESRSVMTTVEPIAVVPKKPKSTSPKNKSNTTPKPHQTPSPIAGAMTVGELHSKIYPSQYTLSLTTLSKDLNKARGTEQLPDDLIALGVVADWQTRASTSNFNNQCRWLRLE